MTVILDLVNKSSTNVAEMYFIGFVDHENISLRTKNIFLAGLDIMKIRFDVWTRRPFCKMPFFAMFGHFLRGLPGLIFVLI